jgi:ABC-type transport system substrate-binding protein
VRSVRVVAVAITLAAATLFLGVTHATAAGPLRLTIGVIGPIGAVDPARATTPAAREVLPLQYPALTAFSLDALDVVPGLAESWTPAASGTGFVYTLRAGAWSDGKPITAADVVASLEHARDENWPYADGALRDLRARALDDRNVEVTSTDGLGALPALPLHVLPNGAAADVSSGDFRAVSRADGELTMEVVDRPGRPALDQIVFRSYSDAPDLRTALQHGDVDIAAGAPTGEYDALRAVPHATVVHASDGDQWVLDLRLADRDLREAIALGVDRDRLVQDAVDGVGRIATVPVFARAADWQLPSNEVDALSAEHAFAPARARALVDRLPERPTVTIAVPEGGTARRVADGVIASLHDVGIRVRRASPGTADMELLRRDPTDDPTAALRAFTCGQGLHCDPAFDAAFATFTTGDVAMRHDAVQEMTRLLTSDATEIPLFAPDELQAFRTDNVTGMLREPEQVRLVTFWPSVQQYREMVAGAPAASEELPTSTFAALAIGVAAVAAVGVVLVDRKVQARR